MIGVAPFSARETPSEKACARPECNSQRGITYHAHYHYGIVFSPFDSGSDEERWNVLGNGGNQGGLALVIRPSSLLIVALLDAYLRKSEDWKVKRVRPDHLNGRLIAPSHWLQVIGSNPIIPESWQCHVCARW